MVAKRPGEKKRRRGRKWVLGVGLDGDDGHVRATRGENFHLLGGSEGTHCQMQEKMVHFNEELARREKTMDDLSRSEFEDIAHEVGLQ